LIEVKAGVNKEMPDYELLGRLKITQTGLGFVLEIDKRKAAASP
jgi:hypothetical protein